MANLGDLYIGGLPPDVSNLLPAFQIKNSGPAVLYDLTVLNFGSARLLVLLDQTQNPTNYVAQPLGPAPGTGGVFPNTVMFAYPIPALATTPGTFSLAYLVPPLRFVNGIWAVLSTVLTTPFSVTTTTTNDGFFVGVGQRS